MSDLQRGIDAMTQGDFKMALEIFEKMAQSGDPEALYRLGELYEEGHGVKQDYNEAARLYEQSAEKGHTNAQINLGSLYYSGNGLPQNFQEAAKWYRRAAEGTI